MNITCPCCQTGEPIKAGDTEYRCGSCGHAWRTTPPPENYYASCSGRNAGVNTLNRKHADRMASIAPLLRGGMRILEIGCADGALGELIKHEADVHYVGLEISPDAVEADKKLDYVHRRPTSELHTEPFDLLLAFHVLEHIVDIQAEATRWRQLLKADGRLIVEVPYRAGHPLLEQDRNPEHMHQFTAGSLAILLEMAGLIPLRTSSGHFESMVYSDSLRIEAKVALSAEQKRELLLSRFAELIPGRFVVYGVGGDFRNYVELLLPHLRVAALCDSNSECWGKEIGNHRIVAYDPVAQAGLPILIASTRHENEIRSKLSAAGVRNEAMISLNRIYA